LLRAEADVHRQRAPADMRQRGMIAVMAVARLLALLSGKKSSDAT
jgi:hypothetical protein